MKITIIKYRFILSAVHQLTTGEETSLILPCTLIDRPRATVMSWKATTAACCQEEGVEGFEEGVEGFEEGVEGFEEGSKDLTVQMSV